jgi:hypothetical protein
MVSIHKCNTSAGGVQKHNFWTAYPNSNKYDIFGTLSSRAIDWYMYGFQSAEGGGGSPGGGRDFLGGVSKNLLGHF